MTPNLELLHKNTLAALFGVVWRGKAKYITSYTRSMMSREKRSATPRPWDP